MPTTLNGYQGSGHISITGGLNLLAEGPERLDPATNTYSGVLGTILNDQIRASFTVGQSQPFNRTSDVPVSLRASGTLSVVGNISPGTYPLNARNPSPQGDFADLVINLPGPQVYGNTGGSLTITESSLIRTEGSYALYRIIGSFQGSLYATGIGTNPNNPPSVTGSFDLLLVKI